VPTYSVHVVFTFSADVDVLASSSSVAEMMVMGADHDQVAHLHGKAYATVNEATREVTSVTEVV